MQKGIEIMRCRGRYFKRNVIYVTSYAEMWLMSNTYRSWMGGPMISYLDYGFEGPGFNPRSQRILCEIRFSVSHPQRVEKMCLVASHA